MVWLGGMCSGVARCGEARISSDKEKKKLKKDRIFILTVGILLVNLCLWTAGVISALVDEPSNTTYWTYLIADSIAITGLLWLFRAYRKGRKRVRELERMHDDTGADDDKEE